MDPSLKGRLDAAKEDLQAALAHLREPNSRLADRARLSEGEKRELSAVAARGDLGPKMRELAARVARHEDSWDSVVSGESPNAALYRPFFEQAMLRFRDGLKVPFDADEQIQAEIGLTERERRHGEIP